MDDFADLNRRIESVLRECTVFDVDHDAKRCRVESGGLQSDWVRWFTRRAGPTRTWDPPSIGEGGMLLSLSGDPSTGVFLPGLYCDQFDAPSTSPTEHVRVYPDGARVSYDHGSGHLSVTGIKSATIQGDGLLKIDMPDVRFTGNVTIEGELLVKHLLTYLAGMAGTGGQGGTKISGDINHSDGTITSNGVTVDKHDHIDSMGGPTSRPRG
jgi:phage baseplate assembly protein V